MHREQQRGRTGPDARQLEREPAESHGWTGVDALLTLQRTAGNAATAALVGGTAALGRAGSLRIARGKKEDEEAKAFFERMLKYVKPFGNAQGKVSDTGLFAWPAGNPVGEDSHHIHLYLSPNGNGERGHTKFMHQRQITYERFTTLAGTALVNTPQDLRGILGAMKEYEADPEQCDQFVEEVA